MAPTPTPELEKTYSPHEVEDRWNQYWLKHQISTAPEIPGSGQERFSVVIPPPNVTGSLHLGHALNNTLQDILVRSRRMQQDATLWVFGTDHAGIATQNVVERQLASEGLSRHDLEREKFIERVWKWKAESGGIITRQLKRLGASLDWTRERFTMDEGLSRAVREVFVRLYDEGLLYRDQRLINWCPRCQTALSDLEVEYHEMRGHLWHIRYFLTTPQEGEDPQHYIVVATTRPETLLGDTAVAANPEDPRYQHLIGKTVVVPFMHRHIPVLGDAYVESTFGTGLVKITPAHDFNDFELGKRHNLERINLLTPDGRMNENAGEFQNFSREECRREIVKRLEEAGQIEKIEEHQNKVGHCYRCRTVVEPYLSLQWFVKTEPLARKAVTAVREGKTRFHPEHWEKTYFSWMENIKDWCVSRQIWWGHRIPAWYCGEGHVTVSKENPAQCKTCHSHEMTQDPDVLDTWFSSALWPFSTLGWPDQTALLKAYYPTNVLVTASDIIFFWVARMMMMGLHFMQEVPFKDVYIHAIVRDAQGQKMSKSKGNIINPLELMEQYGTDAFRFTLAAFAAQGRDIKLSEDRVEGYRNFCNKIWNAARFLFSTALPAIQNPEDLEKAEPQTQEDEWIALQLSQTTEIVTQAIAEYRFNEAALTLYHFIWQIFCDWYLELIKNRLYQTGDIQVRCAHFALNIFDQTLRLLHPFMPFITEELWQKIWTGKSRSIAQAQFPSPLSPEIKSQYQGAFDDIELMKTITSSIRAIRAETGILPKEKVRVQLLAPQDGSGDYATRLKKLGPRIQELGKVSEITWIPAKPAEPCARDFLSHHQITLFIPLTGLIDIEKEKARQKKKLEKVEKEILHLSGKLTKPDFLAHAPEELVAETRLELEKKGQHKKEIEEAVELL